MLKAGELVVDCFAGGGGASSGMEAAIGRSADIAINHDPVAIRMHEVNHPGTRHYIEDIRKVNPVEACAGRPVGFAWFSPDCTHHSRAKGGTPVKQEIRALADVVVDWAAAVGPRVIFVENVSEFQDWGPVMETAKGTRPDPSRKGQDFARWLAELRGLGYAVDFKSLSAADYGAPTTRERFFMIARKDRTSIEFPKATHGEGLDLAWRPAHEIIDWSIDCPSIYTRKRPLAAKTLARIQKGITRYVGSPEGFAPRPGVSAFLIKYYGTAVGQSLLEPLHTVTTKGRFALVEVRGDDVGMRMLQPRELFNAQGFRAGYQIEHDSTGAAFTQKQQIRLAGNSVCPPAAQAMVAQQLAA